MEHVLKTTGLTKKYDRKTVVNNISMTIAPGEVYGFIGRNGAGKTTFMRVVLGMALPDAGEISLFDGEPRRIAGQKIGSIIEAPALFGGCTALENLKRFSLLIAGGAPDNLSELIDLVGLSDAGKKLVGHYSLGMKQRLGLAVAMLGNPQFMVLDEPVNGLDPAGIKDMRDAINVLNREKGVTFLISSHLLDELSRTVTKYGIINDGVLVEEISAAELADKCRRSIAITVDDTAKAFDVLKDIIPADDIRIAGMEINVYNHTAEASALNALLVRNGIAVSSLGSAGYSIENYFIERMGG